MSRKELRIVKRKISNQIKQSFKGKGGNIKFVTRTNIKLGTKTNLKSTDHAIRIQDPKNVAPGLPDIMVKALGGYPKGYAEPGDNFINISSSLVNVNTAVVGKFAGTGLSNEGKATLGRTAAHEFGHSGTLDGGISDPGGHPQSGTLNGNLMHQSHQANAGILVTEQQILKIEKAFNKKGGLNNGNQGN